jgi:hypothetical protein
MANFSNGKFKRAKNLDLEVSNDAEQNKKIKSKKKILRVL